LPANFSMLSAEFPGYNCPGGQFLGMHFLANQLKLNGHGIRIIDVQQLTFGNQARYERPLEKVTCPPVVT
jgi:hypothetical protein